MTTPALIHPDNDLVLRAFGSEIRFHLTGEHTGGQYTMFTEITPPGVGPPPHRHANQDEWFHVLEGRVAFLANGEWHETGPGASVFVPRGEAHSFKNVGEAPSKMLIHVAPSGFEHFFAEAAEEFARPGGPDMGRAVAIAEKHGIQFLAP